VRGSKLKELFMIGQILPIVIFLVVIVVLNKVMTGRFG
tara:strand:- start:5660 stop:5773 length:114 start_codon:yes stop_codon:yes gene_type:complete